MIKSLILLILSGGMLISCSRTTVENEIPLSEESKISIMTFNTEWLLGSPEQVKSLTKKGVWGLETKDTEAKIEMQHQAVAAVVKKHSPDILCLQEVINEIAAKRLQKTLQNKDLNYEIHFLESRDTYLEQDVVFFTKSNLGVIKDIKVNDPESPVYPSKCTILTCLIGEERIALIGLHLKAIPTKPSAVEKREKQADAVAEHLKRLSNAGYSPLVLGDLNDWDPIIPDVDTSQKATPTSNAIKKIKDYIPGGDDELVNSLKWVKPMQNRYTYNYKGSKTVLDHILIPRAWQDRVFRVTIDHKRPDLASDHYPVILDLKL